MVKFQLILVATAVVICYVQSEQTSAIPESTQSTVTNSPSTGNENQSTGTSDYMGETRKTNYKFVYDVNHPEYELEFGHKEQRDGDNTNGAYYVLLPDRRIQTVLYLADGDGYQAKVSYSDPRPVNGSDDASHKGNGADQTKQVKKLWRRFNSKFFV